MMIDHYPTDLFRDHPTFICKLLFRPRRRWLRRILLHRHDWVAIDYQYEGLWAVYECQKCEDQLAGERKPFDYGYGGYGPRVSKFARLLGSALYLGVRYDIEHRLKKGRYFHTYCASTMERFDK